MPLGWGGIGMPACGGGGDRHASLYRGGAAAKPVRWKSAEGRQGEPGVGGGGSCTKSW